MDADHVPAEGYLEGMLQPFIDPTVGYVAAPSICDANAADSWVVRARLFAEATMHGSLQAGYNDGWAPLCIGSHYGVRTAALKEIGGLGPELAEDHTTTLMMNAHGWKGVFAFNAEAHGDGFACFTDLIVQEFQWSRSLMQVLLSVTPRYWQRLSPRLKFQFFFSQVWYPIFGITMLISSLIPIIAVLNDRPWIRADYLELLFRCLILTLTCVAPVIWVSQCGSLRPQKAKVMSWETVLFQFARWPWILFGILSAVINWSLNIYPKFKVTPKGSNIPKLLSLIILAPYLLIGCASAIVLSITNQELHTNLYSFLLFVNSNIYLGLSIIIFWLHLRDNSTQNIKYRKQKIAILGALFIMILATAIRLSQAINAVIWHKDISPIQSINKSLL
jgi:hypothetical protein